MTGVACSQDAGQRLGTLREEAKQREEAEATPCSCRRRARLSWRALASWARHRALAREARISSRRLSSIDLITRLGVLSEATLQTALPDRYTPRSLTQSPPSAIATARSPRTVPGSWAERRSRVGAIASLSAAVRPVLLEISLSRKAPAWEMRLAVHPDF